MAKDLEFQGTVSPRCLLLLLGFGERWPYVFGVFHNGATVDLKADSIINGNSFAGFVLSLFVCYLFYSPGDRRIKGRQKVRFAFAIADKFDDIVLIDDDVISVWMH